MTTLRNNMLNPSVKKVLSVITFGPTCDKGLTCYDWDNMRYFHNSLYMVILTYKTDIKGHVTKWNKKKMDGKKYHRI